MSTIDNMGFIPTKSSLLKRKTPPDFKVVTYESHKAKPKKAKPETVARTAEISKTNEIDMKRARHEIVKLGMSGFDPEKKEEAKIKLAISLGARPPRNKYKNYKQLQEEKKQERESEQKRQEFQQLGKNQLGKSNSKGKFFKRKKEKGGLLDIYGKPSLKVKEAATKNKRSN